MSTSRPDQKPTAVDLRFTPTHLHVRLSDDREIAAPLAWFPRLQSAPENQKNNWRLIQNGVGIHWPDLDEDLSVNGLLTA